ncbi:DEAD/DEAH box helicase family protein [Campylobacter jejuni]|nr:DEAD/DEAH box helicase family protein [Campylobacter jejuni]EKF0527313.1 DEAD/DEAH box helicase family protein [Campylobacter jejuni]
MAKAKQNTRKHLLLNKFIHDKSLVQKLDESYDFSNFSQAINLQFYQQESVKNALAILSFYMKDELNSHQYNQERRNLLAFYQDESENLKLQKEHIARASFWMATGSGKTIVMIKLIALIHEFIKNNQLPKKPIMLLAPNDKILNQFKANIAKYNNHHSNFIKIKDLKDFESIEKEASLLNEAVVYFARSDLLESEENVGKDKKAKRLNYKNYLNKGGWYILLDEAHRGDSKTSLRKNYYHELARGFIKEDEFPKGFVFNFSATFEDEIDFITCAYNYNLQKFNQEGYGKNIAVLNENLDFKSENNEEVKIKTILESFIIFNAIVKSKEELFLKRSDFKYHNPLIIAVSDKVNTQDAGIKAYFKAVHNVLKNKVDIGNIALELYKKLQNQNLHFGINTLSNDFLKYIKNANNDELRENIFYANANANLECYSIKGNDKELAFKSKNSNKPFMLLNISNAKEWEKDFLLELGVESISDISQSHFENINSSQSSINIMLGSKVFSEGWDSNRVNLISFINIGSINAKKYVLQTIGRGVRIEPFLNIRKRLNTLKEMFKIDERCVNLACGLETLFVMASDNEAIKAIIEGIECEFMESRHLKGFKETKLSFNLPVPKYKNEAKLKNIYKISKDDAKSLEELIKSYDEDVLILGQCLYKNFKYSTLQEFNKFIKGKESRIQLSGNKVEFNEKTILKTINSVLNSNTKVLDKFVKLEKEITHHKNIQAKLDFETVQKINKTIKDVLNAKSEDELKADFENKKINLDELMQGIKENQKSKEVKNYIISAKLSKHYYNPLIIYNKNDKESKINFAISNESEKEFLEDLEKNLNLSFFEQYEWYFSKLVENQDEIYIPYFDEEQQKERKFYPDFIFWLKNKQSGEFDIYFIDPKGLKIEDNPRFKLKGFKMIFENKNLTYEDKNIKVNLFFYNKNKNYVSDELKDFVKSNIEDIFK